MDTRLNWDRLLHQKGFAVNGHRLIKCQETQVEVQKPSASLPVERHKTALIRYDLSKPVKSLLEYGLLKPGTTFFDYGCGQGGDVRGLQALGYQADGWDPVFQPGAAKREADVVNLGYVLNVIEDPAERLDALTAAYRLAKRVLVVSALISETVEVGHCPQFGDGVLTRRNTFQKYFEQQELGQYLEDALETVAVPVSLGVFYVFRDASEQQDFLAARTRRTVDWSQVSARLGLGAPPVDRWETLYQQHKQLLDAFGAVALALGRFPSQTEFERLEEVTQRFGSLKRALCTFVEGQGAKGTTWCEVATRFGIGGPARPQWDDQLPAVLRAYVGCTTTLFGDAAQADVIKIHKASGKVTFLVYDDFEGKPLPELQHRIKVNLKTRWVQVFDHRGSGQVLACKERYLTPDCTSAKQAGPTPIDSTSARW